MNIAFQVSKHCRQWCGHCRLGMSVDSLGHDALLERPAYADFLHSFTTEESFCFKSRLSAVRIWCVTLSQDPLKNKSEKWSVPAAGMRGTCRVSHFWPRVLIGQMQAADVSRRNPQDIHPRDSCVSPSNGRRDQTAWRTWRATVGDDGRICGRVDKNGHLGEGWESSCPPKVSQPCAARPKRAGVQVLSQSTELKHGAASGTLSHASQECLSLSAALFLLLICSIFKSLTPANKWPLLEVSNESAKPFITRSASVGSNVCNMIGAQGAREILTFDPAAKACILSSLTVGFERHQILRSLLLLEHFFP